MSNIKEIDPMKSRYQHSLDWSRSRRQEKEESRRTQREKRQGFRFLRKHLGAKVVALSLLPVAATGFAALAGGDERSKIGNVVTIKYGDNLSEIAEQKLIDEGIEDPSTQAITEKVEEIESDSPDLNKDNRANIGDEVVLK